MAEQKTKPSDQSVDAFIAAIDTPRRQEEAPVLVDIMQRVTGDPPVIWGGAMIGFGRYSYTSPSGHSGTWFLTGFRPSKARITVHIMNGFSGYEDLLSRLGSHKHAKSCLYLTALARVDLAILEELLRDSVHVMRTRYGA